MAASLDGHRMSVGSGRHCRSSLDRAHDWCRSLQYDQRKEDYDGGQPVVNAGVRYAVTTRGHRANVD